MGGKGSTFAAALSLGCLEIAAILLKFRTGLRPLVTDN
jgi:hypothetical protein